MLSTVFCSHPLSRPQIFIIFPIFSMCYSPLAVYLQPKAMLLSF
jgi:hypothetical protein